MQSGTQTLIQGFNDESGVTAIEYALLGSLIAVAILVGVRATGTSLLTLYTDISSAVAAVAAVAAAI